ncbi:hypothetical protein JOM56_010210 [Amanita muscaria]
MKKKAGDILDVDSVRQGRSVFSNLRKFERGERRCADGERQAWHSAIHSDQAQIGPGLVSETLAPTPKVEGFKEARKSARKHNPKLGIIRYSNTTEMKRKEKAVATGDSILLDKEGRKGVVRTVNDRLGQTRHSAIHSDQAQIGPGFV